MKNPKYQKTRKPNKKSSEEIVLSAFKETLPKENKEEEESFEYSKDNPFLKNSENYDKNKKNKMFSFFQDPYLLAKYINYILSVLVVFAIAITISLIVRSIFDFSPVWMIVTSFLVLIAISPLTRRIKFHVGYKIQAKYDKFLERFS